MEAGTSRTPVGESWTDREAGREDGAEVRRESKAEFSLGSGEFRFSKTRLDLDARIAQVGDYFIS